MGSTGGFALLDLETTGFGFHSGDRIVEVGIVLTDANLNEEQSWTTLINPQRDVGPSGVHGIRQEWVSDAPTFLEVAEQIASLLNGRHLVAHNSSFDIGFMRSEFANTPIRTNINSLDPICSMRLSKALLPPQSRYKLSWLAHTLGLQPSDHSALGDARTTLELLTLLEKSFPQVFKALSAKSVFTGQVTSAPQNKPLVRPSEPRDNRSGLLEEIRRHLPFRTGLTAGVIEYLEALDEALFDNYLSVDEIQSLISLSKFWELGAEEVRKAHHEYFAVLSQTCWSDGRLTPAEHEMLRIRGEWLGISAETVESGLQGSSSFGKSYLPFGLREGDSVCLTGDMVPPKAVITDLLTRHGIVVKTSVSSKTSLLIAAQVHSLSGKARRARELGVPVVPAVEVSEAFRLLASD